MLAFRGETSARAVRKALDQTSFSEMRSEECGGGKDMAIDGLASLVCVLAEIMGCAREEGVGPLIRTFRRPPQR